MPSLDFIARNATVIENVIEHGFLCDLSSELLRRCPSEILDILRADVDRNGIDLVLSLGAVVHHVQMKARANSELNNPYEIAEAIWSNQSGCVIWVVYSSETMEPISYYLFGCPLPDLSEFKVSEDRARYRYVHMRKANHKKKTLAQLAELLFPSNPSICK